MVSETKIMVYFFIFNIFIIIGIANFYIDSSNNRVKAPYFFVNINMLNLNIFYICKKIVKFFEYLNTILKT